MWSCKPYVIILLTEGEAKKWGYRKGKGKQEENKKKEGKMNVRDPTTLTAPQCG